MSLFVPEGHSVAWMLDHVRHLWTIGHFQDAWTCKRCGQVYTALQSIMESQKRIGGKPWEPTYQYGLPPEHGCFPDADEKLKEAIRAPLD